MISATTEQMSAVFPALSYYTSFPLLHTWNPTDTPQGLKTSLKDLAQVYSLAVGIIFVHISRNGVAMCSLTAKVLARAAS